MKKTLTAALVAAALSGCAMSPEYMAASSEADVCHRYGVFTRNPMFSELTRQYQEEMDRRNLLTPSEKALVEKEHIQRGMGLCALYASWGKPDRENRSVGAWGTHIQHVYHAGLRHIKPTYVYTENGFVTSWQD